MVVYLIYGNFKVDVINLKEDKVRLLLFIIQRTQINCMSKCKKVIKL